MAMPIDRNIRGVATPDEIETDHPATVVDGALTTVADERQDNPVAQVVASASVDPLVEICQDGSCLVTLEYPLERWSGKSADPATGMTKVRVSKAYARHMLQADKLRTNLESDTAYAFAIAQSLCEGLQPSIFGRLSIADLNRIVAVATRQMGK